MADSDKKKLMGGIYKAFGTPKEAQDQTLDQPQARTFQEAHEGAMRQLLGGGEYPAAQLAPQAAPSPRVSPAAPMPAPSPRGVDDQIQDLSDEMERQTGRQPSYQEVLDAFNRRKQKGAREVYKSIE